jgi:predicted DNA-binding transcriptional regulator YafY
MTGPARRDRLERVTDLVLVLLHTEQPLTLDSIANQVPGYPQEHAARRQAFERDKRLLRDEGIPVLTQRLEGDEQYGYLIEREAFYLPDLALEPDEQVALHLAVAGVHLGDPSGRDALLKLGAAGLGEVRPIATLVPPQALIDLFEAVRTRSITTFSYRGSPREVVPVGLWFRFGHWYLVAWDLARTAVRTFRVDRVDGTVEVRPGGHEVPDDIDVRAALPEDPWRSEGDDLVTTRIRVDAIEGPRVAEEVGNDKVESRDEDGSVVLRLRVTNFAAIRVWVLGLVQHAEILEPAEFRADMESWLSAQIDGAGPAPISDASAEPVGGASPTPAATPRPTDEGGVDEVARSNPGKETGDRLRRLLALVGWLAQVGEAPISEVASRFGLGEEELISELELAACCGVPPYTPDALMEIEVTESTVRAFLPADFARPRRLTPAEGFAVAASARLILAVPGSDDDPLRRALAKLDAVMGSREVIGVDVDAPPFLAQVRTAAETGHAIEIDYHSASRDEVTTRVVEPAQAITMDGHWYLDAFCHRAGDMRRFRIDRISAVRLVGEGGLSPRRPERGVADTFVPGPGAVEVQLRLGPGAQWVAESVPVQALLRGDDGLVTDVVLSVAGMAWFERLLLQLGDEASVVRPEELVDLGARAARKVLSVYQRGDEA